MQIPSSTMNMGPLGSPAPEKNTTGGKGQEANAHGEEQHDNRPRKRRKVAIEDVEEEVVAGDVPDEPDEVEGQDSPPAETSRLPTPPVALPSFPLPAAPRAPSRSVLALQGLDRALVKAEVIHPTTVLPVPLDGSDSQGTGLSEKSRKRLGDLGITELFAVQTALLPFLLPETHSQRALYVPYEPLRDVCVSAPTGSGKTLAYVLPIVEILSTRIVTRLRALIVLPTRDLVTQVRETFEVVSKGRGLKTGTATGQHSFSHEQSQLVADSSTSLRGGSSKVDILICTPGRLIDHINGTPNFSLQHLRFLVIDEADRLLAQSFQDWLAQVLAATLPPDHAGAAYTFPTDRYGLPTPDGLAPTFVHHFQTDIDEEKESSCQKLLFSATLTRDPGKLAALKLRDPKYFVVQAKEKLDGNDYVGEQFTMPATLKEHMIICEPSQKPLMLFYLLQNRSVDNALIFTKSSESTSRLVRLFEHFATFKQSGAASEDDKLVIQAYSSDLPAGERKRILEKFKAKEVHLLVCSDLVSRGIDISHVAHVVSYDAPVDMRKYVHRVGRTARAGREGHAWTLVEEQEARYFKTMLKTADHAEKVKRLRVSNDDVKPLSGYYQAALRSLKEEYAR
ncbi:P-loop containing nucleoside triphosphate hydrolase protein [Coniophora puteana RWD-64-598 SS2]|uniref:ATP-dependent RNA helicase n=1 Tax=Coniophora puteana (strain RWD-64-598) TaxID=741705 RepID=A0A5M3MYI2_CONPW|nr:P-loop containing nucleoside triphosphate hydrolase protein [Coniophora puteana RWD-64-598 SS2]EIW84208.1 P-loop containing nucleoside triphosphate hydrolase protein [Coniophora puteana RWD-64-598 SS2]